MTERGGSTYEVLEHAAHAGLDGTVLEVNTDGVVRTALENGVEVLEVDTSVLDDLTETFVSCDLAMWEALTARRASRPWRSRSVSAS